MQPMWIKSVLILPVMLEASLFLFTKLILLPVRLLYSLSPRNSEKLPYEKLVERASQYPPMGKPLPSAIKNQQDKWARRIARLAKLYSLSKILEIGSGAGLASKRLESLGYDVFSSDIADSLNSQQFNGQLKYVIADTCSTLPFPDGSFELVFSINTFEHFQEPEKAFDEMIRVTRKGGLIFTSFGPLFFSPWGLHASRRLSFPYPQLLYLKEDIQQYLVRNQDALSDTYDKNSDPHQIGPFVNQYSVKQFREMFHQNDVRFRIIYYSERLSVTGLTTILKFTRLLKGSAPSFWDLLTSGIKFLAVKQ